MIKFLIKHPNVLIFTLFSFFVFSQNVLERFLPACCPAKFRLLVLDFHSFRVANPGRNPFSRSLKKFLFEILFKPIETPSRRKTVLITPAPEWPRGTRAMETAFSTFPFLLRLISVNSIKLLNILNNTYFLLIII